MMNLDFTPSVRALVCAALLVLGLGARSVAAAEPSDPHAMVRRGIALQREASWTASISTLEKARASGVLSAAERAECAFYLGAAYVAIGSDAAARRELAAVLEAQPGFELPPYTSPKVASLLGEVSRERAQAPGLEPRPPRKLSASESTASDGSGFELGFTALRAHSPIYGVVRFRMRGEKSYREAPLAMTTGGRTALTVAARVPTPQAGVLEYYADALSAEGALRSGSEAQPLELPVPEGDRSSKPAPRSNSRLKLVWLAIPIGVVAGTAIGLGLYYGLSSR